MYEYFRVALKIPNFLTILFLDHYLVDFNLRDHDAP